MYNEKRGTLVTKKFNFFKKFFICIDLKQNWFIVQVKYKKPPIRFQNRTGGFCMPMILNDQLYSLSIIAIERSARALGSAGAGQPDMSSEAF